jgi:hypothetical protein
MKISHRYNFVFFCNPKTGSESVRDLLEPYSDFSSTTYRQRTAENPFYSHMRPVEARDCFNALNWNFSAYQKFVFIRNPWARMVSLYEMIRQNTGQPRNRADFLAWLYTTDSGKHGGGGEDWKRWRKYGTYSIANYAGDDKGEMLVDKILKLECIQEDLPKYLADIGLPAAESLTIPHKNQRSKEDHYSRYYDKQAINFVQSNYSLDIELFDYKFETI